MNSLHWIVRNLCHHRRQHLAVAGGAALAAAALTGALLAGDSLNASLRRLGHERLGKIVSGVELPGRLAPADLAAALSRACGFPVAAVLRLPASLQVRAADAAPALPLPRVQALGVDRAFFSLAAAGAAPPASPDAPDAALASAALDAAVSRLSPDGRGLIRPYPTPWRRPQLQLLSPSATAVEIPLAGSAPLRRASLLPLAILPDDALGRFDTGSEPTAPRNLFVDRDWLATLANTPRQANLFVSAAPPERLSAALQQALEPEHAGVRWTLLPAVGAPTAPAVGWRIVSTRLAFDAAHVAALSAAPFPTVRALYHLADSFEAEGRDAATPYGFVAALSPNSGTQLGVVPATLADDAILISSWLAETLNLATGAVMHLHVRRFSTDGRLIPAEARFTVAGILPMPTLLQERAWMPDFPGLSDVESCADWDIGLPMEEVKLLDAPNTAYWREYGATPKAFITLVAGQRLFGTPFGPAMLLRAPATVAPEALRTALRTAHPAQLGFQVRALAQEAARASAQAMDYRLLFGGMALFLVLAALLLTALLAGLATRERAAETGLLKACGMRTGRLRLLLLAELSLPIASGSLLGAALGLALGALLVAALRGAWRGAIADTPLRFACSAATPLVGALAAAAATLLAVAWSSRAALRREAADLLAGRQEAERLAGRRWHHLWRLLTVSGTVAAALALTAARRAETGEQVGLLFFAAGAALMAALTGAAHLLLDACAGRRPATGPLRAGLLNAHRNPGRGVLTLLPLAMGSFLAVGLLAMRHDPAVHLSRPGAGSGGFAWIAEAPAPLPRASGDAALHARFGPRPLLALRVRPGDEAGCLNLNRAQTPRLVGVPIDELRALRAFSTAGDGSEWTQLEAALPDGAIPALAGDATTLQYGLAAEAGAASGPPLLYPTADGGTVRLRLVGSLPQRVSILQGSVLIDSRHFAHHFGDHDGFRTWLVPPTTSDADAQDEAAARTALERQGWEILPTAERLRALAVVEARYLDIFLVLGGLGVVLGAAAIGLVVLRHAASRRDELTMLRALGLSRGGLFRLLASEHLFLFAAGLAAGVLPALLAIQPALHTLRQELPLGSLAVILTALTASGVGWTLLAAWGATRDRRLTLPE